MEDTKPEKSNSVSTYKIGKLEFILGVLITLDITLIVEGVLDIGSLILICIIIGFVLLYKGITKKNTEKDFRGRINKIPGESKLMIDRFSDAREIAKKIRKSKRFVHVIVGTSGAGKSILIKRYLEDQLKKQYENGIVNQIVIDSYTNVDNEIKNQIKRASITHDPELSGIETLQAIPEGNYLFLVLDQFEKIFKIKDRNIAIGQLKVLCTLFNYCQKRNDKKNIVCMIVMRKESFLNLKFFEDYIPEIKDVHVIEGFSLSSSKEKMDEKIDNALSNLLPDEPMLWKEVKTKCMRDNLSDTYYITSCNKNFGNENNRKRFLDTIILPVELMTVAKSLFITKKSASNYHVDKKNEIRKYFEYYFQSFEKEDAQKIFYALSVAPRSIRSLERDEIARITNIPIERVDRVLEHHLNPNDDNSTESERNFHIIKAGKYYDWKHDFYAEQFNEISGGVLDPIDRDNINYFWSIKENLVSTDCSEETVIENRKRKRDKIGWSIFYISLIILIVRTLYPLLSIILPESFRFEYLSVPIISTPEISYFFKNVDVSFLPIFITLSLWSYYVTAVYRKILARLADQDSPGRRRMSIFVVYWSLLNVILTVISPCLWVFYTGLGGLFMGLKYVQLTTSMKKGHKIKFDENFLKRFGNETVIHSLIMMAIGLGYAFICEPITYLLGWDPQPIVVWVITILLFGGLTYFAMLSINEHTLDKKVTIFLGLAKRYRHLDETRS